MDECKKFEQAQIHSLFEGAPFMGTLLQDYSMCTTELWVNMFMGKVDTIG